MTDVRVREAKPDDVAGILNVARRGWHATYGDILGEETIAAALDEWYDPESTAEAIEREDIGYFVAVEERVVGYVSGSSNAERATLGAIYVDPERWGEGFGTRLLARFERFCRDRDCEAIELHVLSENDVGGTFYRSRGFEPVAEEQTELFGEETTETLFRRPVE